MSISLYRCETPGSVEIVNASQYEWTLVLSKFLIVYQYEYLYNKEKLRFGKETPYGLPGENKKVKIYNGIDREPFDYELEEMNECSKEKMSDYLSNLTEKDDLEVIYIKMADYNDSISSGLTFLGFDVGYPIDGDGFSAINDCMFICRWHGCDLEGTEFSKEFLQLNENGLFNCKEDAINYLFHYLEQEWAEIGDFCILEIYR